MAWGKTNHVELSQGGTTHSFLLQENAEGGPAVRLGNREQTGGTKGRIRIDSLHRGAGQFLARDPHKYEASGGMQANQAGRVLSVGYPGSTTIGTSLAFSNASRCGMLNVGGTTYYVLPTGIYTSSGLVYAAPTDTAFTGSWVIFGTRAFFGKKDTTALNESAVVSYANVTSSGLSGYAEGSWEAWELSATVEKMWAIDAASSQLGFKWTDDTSSANPTFSGTYTLGVADFTPRMLAQIGSHAIIGIEPRHGQRFQVLALDENGLFTVLLQNTAPISSYCSLLGGILLQVGGRNHGIWLEDVGFYRKVAWELNATERYTDIGNMWNAPATHGFATAPGGGVVVSEDDTIFVSLYGTMNKRDGSEVTGSIILMGSFDGAAYSWHVIADPEFDSNLEDARIGAMQVSSAFDQSISAILLIPEGGGSTVKTASYRLWSGPSGSESTTTSVTRHIRTSRYEGSNWQTKHFLRLHGYARSTNGTGTVTLQPFLDGAQTASESLTITPNGTFSKDISAGTFGRLLALDISHVLNDNVTLEFPWEIEYVSVPDQDEDIVQLGILAGAEQPQRTVGLTQESRATTIQNVQSIANSTAVWTLKWWDGMPDWSVIPVGYETMENEGPHDSPEEGSALVWLTLRRVG